VTITDRISRRLMLCCGLNWRSVWCILDMGTRCKVGRICDEHDRAITGYYAD
jgi:hypothetical protein